MIVGDVMIALLELDPNAVLYVRIRDYFGDEAVFGRLVEIMGEEPPLMSGSHVTTAFLVISFFSGIMIGVLGTLVAVGFIH